MKIYNSLTRRKEDFQPIRKGRVGMYVCGPTVYGEPHIGHARSAYIFEVFRRYFEYQGYKVKFVKNITDIDDKIIAKAKEEFSNVEINQAVKKVAAKYTRRYYQDMDALGIRRATFAPCATGHIELIKDYITVLLKKRFAYQTADGVYFDVRQFKDYGRLTRQNLQRLRSAVSAEREEEKRYPLDFALWKTAKPGEPAWPSPWGRGRPGWHIECSVMSSRYLGDDFDIHAGGRDLIFPHHENEIAQSRCFSGKGFARLWMHNGLLSIRRQKMAKSLGNFISVKDFLKENRPSVLKLFFLSSHYRHPIDFTEEKIYEAKKIYERFQIFCDKLERILTKKKKNKNLRRPSRGLAVFKESFIQALDDDLNTPGALAALFDLVNFCNKLLVGDRDRHRGILQGAQQVFRDCSKIFGLEFKPVAQKVVSRRQIESLIKQRRDLRKRGDFCKADQIRKSLAENGIILEDTKAGTRWRRKI